MNAQRRRLRISASFRLTLRHEVDEELESASVSNLWTHRSELEHNAHNGAIALKRDVLA